MFSLIDIESARWANVVFVEPRFKTFNMKMMFTDKKEYFVSFYIWFQTDCANSIRVFFRYCLYRYLTKDIFFNTMLFLDFFCHVRIIKLLKSGDIHAINRCLIIAVIVYWLILKYAFPFIIPINEIKVVLSGRIEFHRLIFFANLLFRWIRSRL